MCEWRRIQTKRKRKLKSFPGEGVKMMSQLEPLRFLEPVKGGGANRQPLWEKPEVLQLHRFSDSETVLIWKYESPSLQRTFGRRSALLQSS
jgi:hypothetical protein